MRDCKQSKAITDLRTAIEQMEKQEPVAWKNAAIRLGEELSSVGPDGYYKMTASQWLDWAMDQQPRGKNSLTTPPAAPVQEPVAWANINKHGDITHTNNKRMPWSKTPLYTTPPAAQRQPLTKEQVLKLWGPRSDGPDNHEIISFARAIEAAHGIKEKNHG